MSKLQTAVQIVKTVLSNPGSLRRVLQEPAAAKAVSLPSVAPAAGSESPPPTPAARAASMKEAMASYFRRVQPLPHVDLLDLLPGLDETITPYTYLEGQALPTDIALLKGLARRMPNCRYLEIGSCRGESMANVASVAAQCVAINLAPAEMAELGYPPEAIAIEGIFSKPLTNVHAIQHNSQTYDYSAMRGSFDLIFIDGDHTQPAVAIDTRNMFPLLRDENSVIVWHDFGHTPEGVNPDVLEGIREGCTADQFQHVYRVSNTLCAIYTRQPMKTRTAKFPAWPDKVFELRLTARRM
jgi:predicted O-methyltransferase YrrM